MIKKEAVGARPFYRPGDVVTNSYGGKGVIVEAKVIVDGQKYDWTEKVPSFAHGWRPNYAVTWITNYQNGVGWDDTSQWKYAWWEAHEWADVELGVAHKIQGGGNENHDD
jgi:hypothetical protein